MNEPKKIKKKYILNFINIINIKIIKKKNQF